MKKSIFCLTAVAAATVAMPALAGAWVPPGPETVVDTKSTSALVLLGLIGLVIASGQMNRAKGPATSIFPEDAEEN